MMVIRAYMASGHRDKPSTKLLVNTVSTRGLIIVMTILLIINMAKDTTNAGVEFSFQLLVQVILTFKHKS